MNYDEKTDGLANPWKSLTYCNPPYSSGELIKWVKKAKEENETNNVESILLVPIDPSTRWWQLNFNRYPRAAIWCALNKRVPFVGASGSPRFSSALIYYGGDIVSFNRHFESIGQCFFLFVEIELKKGR